MHASLREIKNGYKGLKQLAKGFVKAGDHTSAMAYINHCSTIASQFNWIYADDELESALDTIAQSVIDRSVLDGFNSNEDNWVFYDDYCTSYVLALQWMTALTKTGKNILYITSEFSFDNHKDVSILPVIEKMPNVTVVSIQDGPLFERANTLYQAIIRFNASKVILHKAMNSLIQLPLCVLPDEVQVYNINLGDQFFWLGVRHIDYNIEFRPFGASVSVQRRGFNKEQLLMVPFYPANENRPFEGFPAACEGKLVLFSGGDYYKTWDENGTFWRLVKRILDKHDDVCFLFAIKRNPINADRVDEFIRENHFEDRFVRIDRRQDIYQVFSHCDIYMGTSPISGSLMSQLAAITGKPILQYYAPGTPDDETEQALCINDRFQISFQSEDEFLVEADKLISDAEYRRQQGERLKHCMMQPAQFDELVNKTLRSNLTQLPIETRRINYRLLDQRWFLLEKSGFTDAAAYIYSLLGKKMCLRYTPHLFFKKNIYRFIG